MSHRCLSPTFCLGTDTGKDEIWALSKDTEWSQLLVCNTVDLWSFHRDFHCRYVYFSLLGNRVGKIFDNMDNRYTLIFFVVSCECSLSFLLKLFCLQFWCCWWRSTWISVLWKTREIHQKLRDTTENERTKSITSVMDPFSVMVTVINSTRDTVKLIGLIVVRSFVSQTCRMWSFNGGRKCTAGDFQGGQWPFCPHPFHKCHLSHLLLTGNNAGDSLQFVLH